MNMYIYFSANFSKTSAYYFNRESKEKKPKPKQTPKPKKPSDWTRSQHSM